MWPETLWLSWNSNDSQCQLLNNKSSVQVKFTYALWKNSDCMHIDWIKENGKKQDLTSEFMLLAHANQLCLIIICTISLPLLELQVHVEVQYVDWWGFKNPYSSWNFHEC